jgi:hypothetical protein
VWPVAQLVWFSFLLFADWRWEYYMNRGGTLEASNQQVDVDDLDPGGISNASKEKLLGDSPKDDVTYSLQFLEADNDRPLLSLTRALTVDDE